MVELDKVIRALECCTGDQDSSCEGNCPYFKGYYLDDCTDNLKADALELLKSLREENRDLRRELAAGVLRGMPNDWGEYPPEFPREGM